MTWWLAKRRVRSGGAEALRGLVCGSVAGLVGEGLSECAEFRVGGAACVLEQLAVGGFCVRVADRGKGEKHLALDLWGAVVGEGEDAKGQFGIRRAQGRTEAHHCGADCGRSVGDGTRDLHGFERSGFLELLERLESFGF